jgi:type I restriction enzyme S subunit
MSYVYENYLFPENWEEYKLSQLLEVVERPVDMVDDQEYNLITIKRNFGGVESRGKFTGKKILVKSQFEIREGDFIISKRQIVHGACAIIPKKYEGATVSNEYDVMNFSNVVLSSFFDYYVQLPFMIRYFYIASDGVHVEKLRFKTNDWLRQKIRIPSIIEQQNIADILSTWDKAIKLKDQHIVEKKQQKKWLMQNLLTGGKRLPDFHGKWQEVRLGDVCEICTGNKDTQDKIKNGQYPFFVRSDKIERIDTFSYDGEAILTAGDGVGTGKVFHYIVGKFDYHQRVYKISDFRNCTGRFIYYIMREFFYQEAMRYTAKTSVDSLRMPMLTNMKIYLPPPSEQTAIAEILSTADREIDLHEKQLEELKKQKKALMQLLLTGIVRVNAQEVS